MEIINKKYLIHGFVIILFIQLIGNSPTIYSENSIENYNNLIFSDDETTNGLVEMYAIAMGFSFPGIESDAYALRDILHENCPEIWPFDHIKIYSHDSWTNIVDGLRWIESQEDENDITIWQSAGHGSPDGICTENEFISYALLDNEFDRFEGSLLIMICACGSCYAHEKLAGDNRIIITGRSPLNNSNCDCKNNSKNYGILSSSFATYFIMHFVSSSHGAWGNKICDIEYGNNDGWVSAEEAYAYVEDSFEWPDEILNNWCFAHIYMTDGIQGNLDISYIDKEIPPDIHPPETPLIEGPLTGERNVIYNYTIVSTDVDNHNISYNIDWGDIQKEQIGPLPSGEAFTISHNWSNYGNYSIKVLAIDERDYESDWSAINISIPTCKGKITPFFQIIMRYIVQFPIIKKIMELFPSYYFSMRVIS